MNPTEPEKKDAPAQNDCSKKSNRWMSLPMGMLIGVTLGVATDNLGLWLSLGVVFGIIFSMGGG
ncbi:MAG: hypothetical protein AB1813_20380 [Verrucomicrobiota bacterium]